MQSRHTVGPGSQWSPVGKISPVAIQNWVRVRQCKGGKKGGGGVGWVVVPGEVLEIEVTVVAVVVVVMVVVW